MRRTQLVLLVFTIGALGCAPSNAAARGNVLPDATYEALVQVDALWTEKLNDDREYEGTVEQKLRQQAADHRALCDAVPAGDPLLDLIRRQCHAGRKAWALLVENCTTKRGCRKHWKKLDAANAEAYRLVVATNRLVDRTVPAGACRAALRTTDTELRVLRESLRLQTANLRAAFADDQRELEALEKRAKRLAKLKVREPTEIQDAIVDHC